MTELNKIISAEGSHSGLVRLLGEQVKVKCLSRVRIPPLPPTQSFIERPERLKFLMQVFIENEAGSNTKNIFNEKTLVYRKSYTVSREYPYPYGFILNTTSGDGDNLDCFVLTEQPLKSATIVDVEPTGMFEQEEDGQQDHKILAVLKGERREVNKSTRALLKDFVEHVFAYKLNKKVIVGKFLGIDDAVALIKNSTNSHS